MSAQLANVQAYAQKLSRDSRLAHVFRHTPCALEGLYELPVARALGKAYAGKMTFCYRAFALQYSPAVSFVRVCFSHDVARPRLLDSQVIVSFTHRYLAQMSRPMPRT